MIRMLRCALRRRSARTASSSTQTRWQGASVGYPPPGGRRERAPVQCGQAQAADGVPVARFNDETGLAQLHYRVTDQTLEDATREALAALDAFAGVRALIADGALAPPRAITVLSEEVNAEGLSLLGAAEAAARLGVSTSRFRHLRDEHPDFPKPALERAGGALYDAADIDEFKRGWNRQPGRPPKG